MSALGTPLADGSELDPVEHRFQMLRQAPSLQAQVQGRLIEVDDETLDDTVSGSGMRAEIPPRYDMIRRDTQESQVGRQNANADSSPASRPRSADIGSAL